MTDICRHPLNPMHAHPSLRRHARPLHSSLTPIHSLCHPTDPGHAHSLEHKPSHQPLFTCSSTQPYPGALPHHFQLLMSMRLTPHMHAYATPCAPVPSETSHPSFLSLPTSMYLPLSSSAQGINPHRGPHNGCVAQAAQFVHTVDNLDVESSAAEELLKVQKWPRAVCGSQLRRPRFLPSSSSSPPLSCS